MNTLTTLNGFHPITVVLEDGKTMEVKVRQIRLREYQKAFRLMDNEPALVALVTQQTQQQVETWSPESFEAVYTKLQEVNAAGFFTFAARQFERAAQQMRNLPGVMVEKILAAGQAKQASPPGSLIVPPPQG